MKHCHNLLHLASLALVALLMLLSMACSNSDEPTPDIALKFTITQGAVDAHSATFTVTPSSGEATYYANLFTAEETGEDVAAFVSTLTISSSELHRGKKTLRFDELAPATRHRLVVFGYASDLRKVTTQIEVAEITTSEAEQPTPEVEERHTLKVDQLTWRDATLTITPEEEAAEYICGIYSREEYLERFDGDKEQIIPHRLAEWEATALQYMEYGYDDPWQFYMQLEQRSGKRSLAASELRTLTWDSEYVVYCFGMDDEGNPTSAVTVADLKTLAPKPSQNQFEIVVERTTEKLIEFSVTAANDDPYFVTIQRTAYVESFGPATDRPYDLMVADLVGTYPDNILEERFIHRGTKQITSDELASCTINSLREYTIVVCGFENGPTTEVSLSESILPGTTASEELLELTLTVGDVKASSIELTVTASINSRPYYVGLFPAAECSDTEALVARLTAEPAFADQLKQGTQKFLFEELTPETTYRALAFGYNAEAGELTTEVLLSEEITTSAEEQGPVTDEDFLLTVSDLTWHDATITIAPQLNVAYIYGVMTRAEYDEKYAADPNQIVEARKTEWQDIAKQYQEWGYNDPWQYYMRQELLTGKQEVSAAEKLRMRWGREYLCYCFGMNNVGTQTAEVVTTTFSTLAPEPSENQFALTIESTTGSSIHFTVTPSNDDPYYVSIQQEGYVAGYGPDQASSYEDMLFDLTADYADWVLEERNLFTGTQSLTQSHFKTTIRNDRTYRIVVCGFKNGPTTEVLLSEEITPGVTAAQ